MAEPDLAALALLLVVTLLAIAVVSAAASSRSPASSTARFFVGLVAADGRLDDALTLAQQVQRSTSGASCVVGIVVFVTRTDQIDDRRLPPDVRVTWELEASASSSLARGRRLAVERLHAGEDYLVFLHGTRPVEGWTERLPSLLTRWEEDKKLEEEEEDGRVVLTALAEATPSFPIVVDDGAVLKVQPRAFATSPPAARLVAASVYTHGFVALRASTVLLHSLFHTDSQLAQTRALMRRGVDVCVATTVLLCAPYPSRLGVRATSGNSTTADLSDAAGTHPRAGLVDATDVDEVVAKYGSLDAGRAAIREAEVRS